jgi:hypothetical protein
VVETAVMGATLDAWALREAIAGYLEIEIDRSDQPDPIFMIGIA